VDLTSLEKRREMRRVLTKSSWQSLRACSCIPAGARAF